MSRERFNELVEDYALGDLHPEEAREFLHLVETNRDWAREAAETREIARLAHAVPAPSAPPGLLQAALNKARSGELDRTPAPDAPRSADVILVPGHNGTMRRIPVHGQASGDRIDFPLVEPHAERRWPTVNWGLLACAAAALVLGGIVALEVGPAFVGSRPETGARPAEELYLANSTIYESEAIIRMQSRDVAPLGMTAMQAMESPSELELRAEAFALPDRPVAMTAPAVSSPPAYAGLAALRSRNGMGTAAGDRAFGDITPGEAPSAFGGPTFDEPFAREMARADGEDAAATELNDQMAMMMSLLGAAKAVAEEEETFTASSAQSSASAWSLDVAETQPTETQPADELRDVMRRELDTREGSAPMVASATTASPRLLSPVEVEFLLAQARVTGGSEAPPMTTGFSPLPGQDDPQLPRHEIAMVFPDRDSYENFLARVRITPLSIVDSPASPQTPGRNGSAFAYDSAAGSTSRGDVFRTQQPGLDRGSVPSPITGFAAPAPRSGAAGMSAASPSERGPARPATGQSIAASAPADQPGQPELGKPLDLTKYDLRLTTDARTKQVRITLKPLSPDGGSENSLPGRSLSPPPGARR